jgi:hypothetical protein
MFVSCIKKLRAAVNKSKLLNSSRARRFCCVPLSCRATACAASMDGGKRHTQEPDEPRAKSHLPVLSVYVRLWAASTLLRIVMATGRGDPLSVPLKLLTMLVFCAALIPRRAPVVAAALALRVALFFTVGGPLSNSQVWAMNLDLTVRQLVIKETGTVALCALPPLRACLH